jgi:hypothetical protein
MMDRMRHRRRLDTCAIMLCSLAVAFPVGAGPDTRRIGPSVGEPGPERVFRKKLPAAAAPFAVEDWGPRMRQSMPGELESPDFDESSDAVFVRFNRAVVHLGSPAMWNAQDVLEIRPELPRQCQWDSPESLICTPSTKKFHPATRYQVTVNPKLRALDGAALRTAHVWSFESDRPRIDVMALSGDRFGRMNDAGLPMLAGRSPIVLESSLPIDLAALRAKAAITADGKPVPIEASYLPANAQMTFLANHGHCVPEKSSPSTSASRLWTVSAISPSIYHFPQALKAFTRISRAKPALCPSLANMVGG